MAFANASEARSNGWFSRKYKSSEGLMKYRLEKEARLADQARRSEERDVAARKRSPRDQLARLDSLLGKDVGAVRERARLKALMGLK